MLLMLMLEVWKRDEAYQKQVRKKSRRKMQQRESIRRSESLAEKCFSFMTSCNPLDIKMNSIFMRNMTNHYLYRYLTAFLLAFAAFLELWVIQHPNSSRLYVERLQLILQFIFSLDIAFKLLANYPACAKFFNDGWNIFDFVLVVGTWVPIFTVGQPGHEYFGLLRVFRILRLLRLLSWIADLNIMLRAISSSAKAMVY
ncbi:CACNA1F, partial [Symbiodinium microadriaticum]